MTYVTPAPGTTDISEDAARGALSPNAASAGADLTPMLIWGTTLSILAMMVVAILMQPRG